MKKNYYATEMKLIIDELTDLCPSEQLFHPNKEGEPFPSRAMMKDIIKLTRSILFPGFFGNGSINKTTLPYHIGVNLEKVFTLLWEQVYAGLCFHCKEEDIDLESKREKAYTLTLSFIKQLPRIKQTLRTDVEALFKMDPAAKSYGEIILSYPGLRAITNYRIAHELFLLEIPIIPRIITEMAHAETGIDIHPGAKIGESFAIDHGTGVVIGETCIIGNNVRIYQGVTLGAKSFPVDEHKVPIKGIVRHPMIQDNVVIYASATILGRIVIGENAVIGGNTWITEDVAENAKIFIK
ncbi:MAG: serine acetyltransferase [Paludibacteraceae bacterium]|nr:serine acetyltransferase [Paludibacteraceae bacterium]MBP6285015.1 serine acetyltransferase [Paludibacteraceae bacterium]